MRSTNVLALASALVLSASAARAQTVAPPDPATIELPDLTPPGDPAAKYYYFHKPGISYPEAYADFAECYRYLPVAGADPTLPMFAPWTRAPGVGKAPPSPVAGGLIGMGIVALISGPINRRARQAPLRRCLETRGYVRYPLSEESWERLIDDYSPRSIAVQAKAASMPAPAGRPVAR